MMTYDRYGVGALAEAVTRFKRDFIIRTLRNHRGNRLHTARALGITRQALNGMMRRHGIYIASETPQGRAWARKQNRIA